MITSKQRATLRKHANKMETIFQIGKSGVTEQTIKELDVVLKKREMIKIKVLENSLLTAKEVAGELAQALDCEIVQTIGTRVVIYKRNDKEPIYEIN